jgi:hypothetical protein
LDITIDTLNLKKHFENSHHAAISQVVVDGSTYYVLVNIWENEKFNSQQQQILIIENLNIVKSYKLPDTVLWNCMQVVANGSFLLGSSYLNNDLGGILILYQNDRILFSETFDKGYSTEIKSIERGDKNDSYIIHGYWYQPYSVGGHDEFQVNSWLEKIELKHSGFSRLEVTSENHIEEEAKIYELGIDPQYFYKIENYGISKYSTDNKLIWKQGLGQIALEDLQPLNTMAPFFKNSNGKTIQDGVWFSGTDHTDTDRGFSKVLFGRITAGGTILSFKNTLSNFPEIYKIHIIVPGNGNNCLLIGETQSMRQGSGLFLLYNYYLEGNYHQQIKYVNFIETDLTLINQDKAEFNNCYLNIKEICPQSERLEDLKEIIIFGNASHLRNRDNGDVWSIAILDSFV